MVILAARKYRRNMLLLRFAKMRKWMKFTGLSTIRLQSYYHWQPNTYDHGLLATVNYTKLEYNLTLDCFPKWKNIILQLSKMYFIPKRIQVTSLKNRMNASKRINATCVCIRCTRMAWNPNGCSSGCWAGKYPRTFSRSRCTLCTWGHTRPHAFLGSLSVQTTITKIKRTKWFVYYFIYRGFFSLTHRIGHELTVLTRVLVDEALLVLALCTGSS